MLRAAPRSCCSGPRRGAVGTTSPCPAPWEIPGALQQPPGVSLGVAVSHQRRCRRSCLCWAAGTRGLKLPVAPCHPQPSAHSPRGGGVTAGRALLWQQDVVWDVTSPAACHPHWHWSLDMCQPRDVPELLRAATCAATCARKGTSPVRCFGILKGWDRQLRELSEFLSLQMFKRH